MKKLTTAIANLKISSKIWLCMVTIALSLSLFIGLFSSHYFAKLYREDTYVQTADSLQIGSQALTDSYNLLLMHVFEFASTPEFARIVSDIRLQNHSDYTSHKAAIQEPMSYLTLKNPILDSVTVLGENGEYYSLYTNTLKRGCDSTDVFGWDLSAVSGITWLPLQKSPYMRNNDIIPVVLPLSTLIDSRYLHITDTTEDADVLIVLMLDRQNLYQRLALTNSAYTDRTLYITDSMGRNLNLPGDAKHHAIASSPDTINLLAEASPSSKIQLLYDDSEYSLYSQSLDFCGLTLVEILPKWTLHQRLLRMNTFILLLAMLGLVMAALLSFLLSRFVTRPFKQLIQNIQNIENSTYDTPYQMKYQDEIGRLNMAINSMYTTITQQFQCLKQSERAKYRSEIQLLSEQINPHFLYNTLECINMEVLGGHKESASSMITTLGDFLRIGLNYGNEVISISREMTHVESYLTIMNHRFSQKIEFSYTIDPELIGLYILKSILQPLAENAILHGFQIKGQRNENYSDVILLPKLEVHVFQKDCHVVIEVIDNGRGIDIEKAKTALYPEASDHSSKSHVGLNNVYQRLTAYYETVFIDFETIPYYKNTVRITLPLKDNGIQL